MKNYEDILYDLISADERVMVLTAENRASIRNLPPKIQANFIDTGITEQTMIGVSAGLALRGRIPVAHALATFLTMRAFEFIRTDVGIGNLPVKIVGSFAGLLSEANGPTHQAIEDVALMRGIPNMNIFCPADEEDMLMGLPEIIMNENPFYIRYNNLKPTVRHSDFRIGEAEIFGDGSDIVILTYGTLFNESVKCRDILEESGYSVKLVNLRTLKPIDTGRILPLIEESGLIVTVEDHFLTGGLFSIISELMALHGLHKKIYPIGFDNRWFKPALLKDVLEYERLSASNLAERIKNFSENK
jgi:transketolase